MQYNKNKDEIMEDKQVKVESVSIQDADKDAENVVAQNPEPGTGADTEIDARVAELQENLAILNDKYLRMAAELENTRRRAAIDAESRARSRAMAVAEKILPLRDAVDAALRHSPEDEGIKSMARALDSAFDSIGITKIDAVGQSLNPTLHNAIQVVAASENVAPNTVVEEMQAGYMFGDTVMRTAMVVVAK